MTPLADHLAARAIDCDCGAGPFSDPDAVLSHARQWHPESLPLIARLAAADELRGVVRLRGGLTIDAGALAGIVTRAGMLGSADVACSEYLARVAEAFAFPRHAVHAALLEVVRARLVAESNARVAKLGKSRVYA